MYKRQTQDEYENLRVYLYEPYERMGGNGSAKRIIQEAVSYTHLDVYKRQIVSCVPQLADGALQLVVGVLAALVTYTPQIVDFYMTTVITKSDRIIKVVSREE